LIHVVVGLDNRTIGMRAEAVGKVVSFSTSNGIVTSKWRRASKEMLRVVHSSDTRKVLVNYGKVLPTLYPPRQRVGTLLLFCLGGEVRRMSRMNSITFQQTHEGKTLLSRVVSGGTQNFDYNWQIINLSPPVTRREGMFQIKRISLQ
jgi:hypothetical protein